MGCLIHKNCGGCVYRNLDLPTYQKQKEASVKTLLEQNLGPLNQIWEKPIFIADGTRRRASFAFTKKQKLIFGFNANKSSEIIDITQCDMLSPKINAALPSLRLLLEKLCALNTANRHKSKQKQQIVGGDLQILEAQNGLDIVL